MHPGMHGCDSISLLFDRYSKSKQCKHCGLHCFKKEAHFETNKKTPEHNYCVR